MALHDLAATWLGHLLSSGDAPGSGPGPFETIFGLPGMPGPLKKLGELADSPDKEINEDDAIDMLSDMAPLPIGPAGETAREGKKNVDDYVSRKRRIIEENFKNAKHGDSGEGE